jgi:hypothetical protein
VCAYKHICVISSLMGKLHVIYMSNMENDYVATELFIQHNILLWNLTILLMRERKRQTSLLSVAKYLLSLNLQ